MLPWAGYYINLDRSPERRLSVERALAKAGLLHYSRFAAVDGLLLEPMGGLTRQEYGCFKSHLELLRSAARSGRFIHVVEDDAVFSEEFSDVLNRFIGSGALDDVDLVFTDVIPTDLSLQNVRKLKRAFDADINGQARRFRLIDLRHFHFAGANSYLVSMRTVDRVIAAIDRELGNRQRVLPIDLLYRREIGSGSLKATAIFPFISAVNMDLESTISDHSGSLEHGMIRDVFYSGGNPLDLVRRLRQLNAATAHDLRLDALAEVHKLMIAKDRFQE